MVFDSKMRRISKRLIRDRWAPLYADEILSGEEGARRYLFHEDALVRLAALEACRVIHRSYRDPRFAETCLAVLDRELFEGVQMCAITTIEAMLSNSQDRRAKRILSKVVLDNEAALEVRRCAYSTLWEIEYGDNETIGDAFLIAWTEGAEELIGVQWEFVLACYGATDVT